ncbi:hypothetical protein [Halosimplex pelagicum]|uniref:Uncharacterized protein n=1 Tax=Halosimplex pelagicum TaxID=869886 RepID=A0A7D5P8J6_9EURY|nr:hypothetical protein [Halosimplex pelagicum]QLH83403.1 hypothetical protein HZS54_17970 [Halosimplex pelagicum]
MKDALKRVGILALAVLLATTAAAGAVQFDDEQTNTATDSDVTATSNVVEYNSSADIYLEAVVETTSPAILVEDPETNETLVNKTGSDLTQTYSDESSTPNVYHYSANVSQSVLSSVEMAAGENKSFEVTIVNDVSAADPSTTTQTMYVHNDPKRTYLKLTDAEVGEDGLATLQTETLAGYQLPIFGQEVATIEQSVPVNGSATTATIDVKNSTLSDRLSSSASGKSSGDWIVSTLATVDDEPARVFMDETPDSVDNETHLVYHSGSDSIEVVTGEDYSGESADVWIDANRGFRQQIGNYGIMNVLGGFSLPF